MGGLIAMTIAESWKTALVVSLTVALVVASIEYFLFSGGTVYVAQVEWDKVDAISYKEGTSYLAERLESILNWESVVNGSAYKEFWLRFMHQLVTYFFLLLGAAFVLRGFINPARGSSGTAKNPTPQPRRWKETRSGVLGRSFFRLLIFFPANGKEFTW